MRTVSGAAARRTPTNILEMRGSNKHRLDRKAAREHEPVPVQELGEPPAHLTPEQRICWAEFVDLCCVGVLFKVDRVIVEQGACLLARIRARNWDVDPRLMVRLEHVLACLGMTPADRSRVKVPKSAQAPKSPYDD